MTAKTLKNALQRVEAWPEHAQDMLAELALEIDQELREGKYHATPAELAGIGRETALARRFQAAIDASKLRRRRMIFALAQLLVNFEREFDQHVLRMFRPSFHALKCILKGLRCHTFNITCRHGLAIARGAALAFFPLPLWERVPSER